MRSNDRALNRLHIAVMSTCNILLAMVFTLFAILNPPTNFPGDVAARILRHVSGCECCGINMTTVRPSWSIYFVRGLYIALEKQGRRILPRLGLCLPGYRAVAPRSLGGIEVFIGLMHHCPHAVCLGVVRQADADSEV